MDPAELKSKHLKIKEEVATRELDGETFMVTPGDWKLHRFNPVGERIWALSQEGKSIAEIIEEIALVDPAGRADVLRQKMHRALREYFNFTLKRRPVILPFVLEL